MVEVKRFWTWSATAAQSAGGGGSITVDITPAAGTAIRLMRGSIGTAAARTVSIYHIDEDDGIQTVIFSAALNNQTVYLPGAGAAVGAGNQNALESIDNWTPGDGSRFTIVMSSAANTESIVMKLAFEIIGSNVAPTISVARSAGTVAAPTETQNEVTSVVVG